MIGTSKGSGALKRAGGWWKPAGRVLENPPGAAD